MNLLPSNGDKGRGSDGRFLAGNAGGHGNPHAKKVAALREALLAAVSTEDIREMVAILVKQAKDGDVMAAREVLDRVLGKSKQETELNMTVEAPAPVGVKQVDLDAYRRRMLEHNGELIELRKRVGDIAIAGTGQGR